MSNGEPVIQKVVAMENFISVSPWEAGDISEEIQAVLAEGMQPSCHECSMGTVGVIDESEFVKQPAESVGVDRQWCGRLGNTANCQVGVYRIGVTRADTAMLDRQLFLTKDWAKHRVRHKTTRVPKEVRFRTKPELAADTIRRTESASKVRFDWTVADELYGDSGPPLDACEEMHQRYLLEVKKNLLVSTVDPATLAGYSPGPKRRKKLGSYKEVCSVEEIAAELPNEACPQLKLREEAKGLLVYEFAASRVGTMRHGKPVPPLRVLFRTRSPTHRRRTTMSAMLRRKHPGRRWRWSAARVGTGRSTSKTERCTWAWLITKCGLGRLAPPHELGCPGSSFHDAYQTRPEKEKPELTLDMAVQLLRSAFARQRLIEQDAIRFIEYHLERNRIAQSQESHRNSWLPKHKRAKPEVLL